MRPSTFLANEPLWETVTSRVKAARHVDAAIAYFGRGGAKLLPLRLGDRLVVDMSPSAVHAGVTDPYEVEKLFQRGVRVFSRRSLHAKVVVADNCLICSSANASKRSLQVLDEAALLTYDAIAVRRAREFIAQLLSEPVRLEYLEQCKRLYRPPRFSFPKGAQSGKRQRARHAKLWIVSLRADAPIPISESRRYEKGEAKARKLIADKARSKTDSFHWPREPRMASELQFGDWLIQAIKRSDGSIVVYPPGQLLFIDKYIRHAREGRLRWVFHLEVPKRGQTMPWSRFRRAAKSFLGSLAAPRTRPVREVEASDQLMRLWTTGGRVSRR